MAFFDDMFLAFGSGRSGWKSISQSSLSSNLTSELFLMLCCLRSIARGRLQLLGQDGQGPGDP